MTALYIHIPLIFGNKESASLKQQVIIWEFLEFIWKQIIHKTEIDASPGMTFYNLKVAVHT